MAMLTNQLQMFRFGPGAFWMCLDLNICSSHPWSGAHWCDALRWFWQRVLSAPWRGVPRKVVGLASQGGRGSIQRYQSCCYAVLWMSASKMWTGNWGSRSNSAGEGFFGWGFSGFQCPDERDLCFFLCFTASWCFTLPPDQLFLSKLSCFTRDVVLWMPSWTNFIGNGQGSSVAWN